MNSVFTSTLVLSYGQPGVELAAHHHGNIGVSRIYFLPGQVRHSQTYTSLIFMESISDFAKWCNVHLLIYLIVLYLIVWIYSVFQ